MLKCICARHVTFESSNTNYLNTFKRDGGFVENGLINVFRYSCISLATLTSLSICFITWIQLGLDNKGSIDI